MLPLVDFGKLEPTRERKEYFEFLRSEEDEYFDDVAGRWDSERVYLPDEANDMAQSLHRYRLEVWPESHWPGFALRQADVFQSYTAW